MKKLITLITLSLVVALANAVNITVDDFHGLNTAANTNNLVITETDEDETVELKFGAGTSNNGWDAFGTGTSTFGQSGAWFDGSYVKFGNSANQQLLDFRITNNTGEDQVLRNLSFDIRKPSANANPTSYNLYYLDAGNSELIKGASVAAGSEMANLAGLGTGTINGGINNYSNVIGTNIQGTAWIPDGGYANIRLKINTGNNSAGSQLDNFSVIVVPDAVPEPSTYALLSGIFVMAWIGLRRRSVK